MIKMPCEACAVAELKAFGIKEYSNTCAPTMEDKCWYSWSHLLDLKLKLIQSKDEIEKQESQSAQLQSQLDLLRIQPSPSNKETHHVSALLNESKLQVKKLKEAQKESLLRQKQLIEDTKCVKNITAKVKADRDKLQKSIDTLEVKLKGNSC